MRTRNSIVTSSVAALCLTAASGCKPAGEASPPQDVAAVDGRGSAPAPTSRAAVRFPVPGDPTISYSAWFQIGSQHDPPGKEGLTWLTAQLLAEGGTRARTYDEITRALYPLAAGYGARVDREMVTISGRAHRDTDARFRPLYVESFTAPGFADADFERLKAQALDYLTNTLRYASDEELGKAALMSFVFEGTRYAHPVHGTVAGLESITIEDVRAHYQRHFVRDAVVFALGGGYDEGTLTAFEASRAALPAGAAAPAPTIETRAILGREVLLVDKPGADASISIGYPLHQDVRRGTRDYYALWIANSWLGEHRNSSSHLFDVIRERRGLNYGDYSYIEAFPNGGRRQMPPTNVARRHQLFEIWIRTLPNDKAVFALRLALRELDALVAEGMTPEEFELTRTFLRKYALHFADTTRTRLGYAIDDRFYGLDAAHLERFREMMDTLTLEDVNGAIRRHLQSANLKIAIVTGAAGTLSEQLASGAPTPITYDSEKPAAVLEEDKVIASYPLNIKADNIRTTPVDAMFAR